MPFITFIYRIGNNKKTFYGKYVCDYISDDHEGLDIEVISSIMHGIHKYREQKGLPKLKKAFKVGILSFSQNSYIPTYSTDAEIECFDFYHKQFDDYKGETYVNGKLLT